MIIQSLRTLLLEAISESRVRIRRPLMRVLLAQTCKAFGMQPARRFDVISFLFSFFFFFSNLSQKKVEMLTWIKESGGENSSERIFNLILILHYHWPAGSSFLSRHGCSVVLQLGTHVLNGFAQRPPCTSRRSDRLVPKDKSKDKAVTSKFS